MPINHDNTEASGTICVDELWRLTAGRDRHEFYETDEKLTLSVFDKGADPAQVSVQFGDRSVGNISCLPPLLRSCPVLE